MKTKTKFKPKQKHEEKDYIIRERRNENTYKKRSERSKNKSVITAKVSIRKESPNKGSKVASSMKDVHNIGCSHGFHLKHNCEVN